MLSPAEEMELLYRAAEHGHLRMADLAQLLLDYRAGAAHAVGTEAARWGPRIAFVVQRGLLDLGVVKQLSNELKLAANASTEHAAAANARRPLDSEGLPGSSESADLPALRIPAAYPVKDWDRYEFLKLLGRGGMGIVYKARDRRLGRLVALKFINGADERLVRRFMQEARAQSRLDHPNVCKVYDVGEVEGKVYIAMQLIDGDPLTLAATSLSIEQKVKLIKAAAHALHAAHELGIIHRACNQQNLRRETF